MGASRVNRAEEVEAFYAVPLPFPKIFLIYSPMILSDPERLHKARSASEN
jgi:hypothetical protein